MERTNHVDDSEQSLVEPLRSRRSYEDEVLLYSSRIEGVHIASVEEKKRLWWKNAVINTLFMLSWYVSEI